MIVENVFMTIGMAAQSSGGMWNGFVNFLSGILTAINGFTGNFGLSVILFTILMRFVLLPLDLKSKASTKKMGELQPELQKINEKYKNDQEKRTKMTMELYRKHNINPMGGCLPALIQLPVFFALFAALRAIASMELEGFFTNLLINHNESLEQVLLAVKEAVDSGAIKTSIADTLQMLFRQDAKIIEQLKGLADTSRNISIENINLLIKTAENINLNDALQFLKSNYSSYSFLWIKNIWVADSPLQNIIGAGINFDLAAGQWNGLFILSALAGATSYYQMKYLNPSGQNQQTKGFSTIFPLMSVWFTSMYTAAFGIYWVTSNIFQIIQQFIINMMEKKKTEA